ncbi:MAG: hypothetical protein MSC31_13195 [Solirubrobacteraceae bacterium MAG38_C4-C5]|nr:hypothetical protein [Candidatus Siliceabacter maunaloa]
MATISPHTFNDLTDDEAVALLDRQTRKYLHLSAKEFIARWDAGEFRESADAHVSRLSILIPFGRSHAA